MTPEELRTQLIEHWAGKFALSNEAYHKDMHGSILLQCPLRGYLDRVDPTLDVPQMIYFKNGLLWDSELKDQFTELFGATLFEKTEFAGAVFSPDYVGPGYVAEFKFTKYLKKGNPREKDVQQLAHYCAVFNQPVGYLIYVTLSTYQEEYEDFKPDVVVFEFHYNDDQLAEIRQILTTQISQYILMFSVMDGGQDIPKEEIKPIYKWECKYCSHTFRCEEIKKESDAVAYKQVEDEPIEYPETHHLSENGDSIEGFLRDIRLVEIPPKDGKPARMTTVYEFELINKKGAPTGEKRSVWGGRVDWENKVGKKDDAGAYIYINRRIKVTRQTKKGNFIPFVLEVWEE